MITLTITLTITLMTDIENNFKQINREKNYVLFDNNNNNICDL
jgi:hypothetical protein